MCPSANDPSGHVHDFGVRDIALDGDELLTAAATMMAAENGAAGCLDGGPVPLGEAGVGAVAEGAG
jgi:hypothetical protein